MVSVNEELPSISYSPPSYHHFGLAASLMDPFENRTVYVRSSDIEGEGLFAKRKIRQGELVSFYSGFVVHKKYILSPLNRHNHKLTARDRNFIEKYSLQFSNETHSDQWHDLAIDIPPEYAGLDRYRVTLGHKANHSFRHNSAYTLFTGHPVLGTIMCVTAVRDIEADTEITTNYNYKPETYKALGWTLADNQCLKVKICNL